MHHLVLYTFFGGVTGYVTNWLAIDMLFRKRLGLGGVVTATRHQLAEELGALVEREIINNRTIENELAKDDFKKAFRAVVADFLGHHLYKNIPDSRLGDLPGMERTGDNILAFCGAHMQDIVGESLRLLAAHGLAEDLVSSRQWGHVSTRVYDLALDVARRDRLARNLVDGLYQEWRGRKISYFVSGRVLGAVAGSLERGLADFHQVLQRDFDPQIDDTLAKVYGALDVDGLVSAWDDMICHRTPAELVGRDRVDELADDLLGRCVEFMESAEGRRLVEDFAVRVMVLLKEVKTPLLDLLGPDLQTRVKRFLQRELPVVISGLISWLWEHKAEIEDLIEETIDDVLAAEADAGFAGWLKKQLKDAFLPSITKQYDVMARIVAAIEGGNVEELSRQFSAEIIKYIKGNSVAGIVAHLENRGLVTPELIAALIRRNLAVVIPRMRLGKGFLETPIGSLLGKGALADLWDQYCRPALFQYLKDSLYSRRTTQFLQREAGRWITGLETRSVSDIISPAGVMEAAPLVEGWVLDESIARRERFAGQIAAGTRENMQGLLVGDAVLRSMAARASYVLMDGVRRGLAAAGDRRVRPLYEMVAGSPAAVDGLTNAALGLTNRHLESLLEGNIRTAVTDNLLGLTDDELRDKVQGFIGGELRPITRLGALFGTISGPVSLLPGFSAAPLGLLAYSAGLFGAIGLGTNWVALTMLFRPHRERRILNHSFPLTPGVIPKNQARFAREMSGFIKDELLDRETVRTFFAGVRDKAETELLVEAAARDYEVIKELLRREQAGIVDFAARRAVAFSCRRQKAIADLGVRLATGIDLKKWDFAPERSQFSAWLVHALSQMAGPLENGIVACMHCDRTLGSVLPAFMRGKLAAMLDENTAALIGEVARGLGDDAQFDRWLGVLAPAFNRLTERTLGDLAGDRQDEWRDKIVSVLMAQLTPSMSGRVVSFMQEKLADELHPERKISDVFDGFLVELLETNVDHLLDHIMGLARSLLEEEQPKLAVTVKKAVWEGRGGLGKLGLGLLNVNRTIDLVLDELVRVRIPLYLDGRKAELRDLMQITLEDGVFSRDLGALGISLNADKIQNITTHLMENPDTTRVVRRLTGDTVNSLFHIPLKSMLRIVSLSSFADVRRLFAAEIKTVRFDLANRLETTCPAVRGAVAPLLGDITDHYLGALTLREILGDIPREHVGWSVRNMLKTVPQSEAFGNVLDTGLRRVTDEIRLKQPHDFIDFGVLRADISAAVGRLAASEPFHRDLREMLGGLTDRLVRSDHPRVLVVLDRDTVDYVLRVGASGLMDALEDHLGSIVNAVHVGEVAERELNRLNPAQIEELFASFAGDYFTRLKLYGLLFGGLIGGGTGLAHLVLPLVR